MAIALIGGGVFPAWASEQSPRMCSLALLKDEDQQLDAIRGLLNAKERFTVQEFFAFDRIAASIPSAKVHDLVPKVRTELAPVQTLAQSRYSVGDPNWLTREQAVKALLQLGSSAQLLAYLDLIIQNEKHSEVLRAARSVRIVHAESLAQDSVAEENKPQNDREYKKTLRVKRQAEFNAMLERLWQAQRDARDATLTEVQESKIPHWRDIKQRIYFQLDDVDLSGRMVDDSGKRFVLAGGKATRLNRFTAEFQKLFPDVALVFTHHVAWVQGPDGYEFSSKSLILPLSLMQDPNLLPTSLVHLIALFQADRKARLNNLPSPFAGVVYPNALKATAKVNETVRNWPLPLGNLWLGQMEVREAWLDLRQRIATGVPPSYELKAVQALRGLIDQKMWEIERVRQVFSTLGSIDVTVDIPKITGKANGIEGSITYIPDHSQISVTLRNDLYTIYTVSVPEKDKPEPFYPSIALASQVAASTRAVDELGERYADLRALLSNFIVSRGTVAGLQILDEASFPELPAELDSLANVK